MTSAFSSVMATAAPTNREGQGDARTSSASEPIDTIDRQAARPRTPLRLSPAPSVSRTHTWWSAATSQLASHWSVAVGFNVAPTPVRIPAQSVQLKSYLALVPSHFINVIDQTILENPVRLRSQDPRTPEAFEYEQIIRWVRSFEGSTKAPTSPNTGLALQPEVRRTAGTGETLCYLPLTMDDLSTFEFVEDKTLQTEINTFLASDPDLHATLSAEEKLAVANAPIAHVEMRAILDRRDDIAAQYFKSAGVFKPARQPRWREGAAIPTFRDAVDAVIDGAERLMHEVRSVEALDDSNWDQYREILMLG